jgi:hypothetical protein
MKMFERADNERKTVRVLAVIMAEDTWKTVRDMGPIVVRRKSAYRVTIYINVLNYGTLTAEKVNLLPHVDRLVGYMRGHEPHISSSQVHITEVYFDDGGGHRSRLYLKEQQARNE